MDTAEVRIHPDELHDVSPLLFGGMIEHLARCIYGGIWDLERDVPRADVLAAVRGLGPTVLRWPGGCFSAWYRWRDGIGAKAGRPRHDRTYWTNITSLMGAEVAAAMGPAEPNAFGTDEFLRYCLDVDSEPVLAVNIASGEGAADEAAGWVSYCNVERKAPRPVGWWAIGNETWGAHELGHRTAAGYASTFDEFGVAMRRADPSIRLVGVGQCPDQYGADPSGAAAEEWNRTVLSCREEMGALSIHWYFPGMTGRRLRDDEPDALQMTTGSDDLERVLTAVGRTVEEVRGARSLVPLSVDEWGQMVSFDEHFGTNHRLCDGVFFAGCFNALLRHADHVSMAMIAQLVNVLAPIQTSDRAHFVTAAYLVALLYRRAARARSARIDVASDSIRVPQMTGLEEALFVQNAARGERTAAVLDAAATVDATGATVFLTNRSLDREVKVAVHGLADPRGAVVRSLSGPGPFARNDVHAPAVLGFAEHRPDVSGTAVSVVVPPCTAGALIVR